MLPRQPAESEGLPSDECWRRFAPSVDRIRSDVIETYTKLFRIG
eukprot:gene32119-40620_t